MAINFNYNYPQVAREAGFKLRQYKDGPIDWRILGSIEIERLLQDQRLEQMDALLAHLAEAPLATILDTNILDSGIAKYFIVSQFAIQYLLFCRKFLDETVRDLREAHAESQMDVAKLRKSLAEANNEILQLHKKITQIEAIHEVVYPCHICTKSFISNEALNIHISRRHAARLASGATGMGSGVVERRTDTPASGAAKEREHHDLQLINAIKLELEIKQLKERLNNAERDIRERSIAAANSRRVTPREPPSKSLKSVAIQSELLEIKEQDDSADATLNSASTDSSEVKERKAQLSKLQSKIQEFEAWRETQQTNNEESIAEINRKLGEIVHSLEEAKSAPSVAAAATVTALESKAKHKADENDENDDDNAAVPLQRRGSPSVEDLERLLTQKVVEIGQKSAEKLEEFVQNMEANYKEKLEELEREIKKRNAAELESGNKVKASAVEASEMRTSIDKTSALATSTPEVSVLPRDITYTAFNPTDSDSSLSVKTKPEPAKRMPRIKRSPILVTETNLDVESKSINETFIVKENVARERTTVAKPKPRARRTIKCDSPTSKGKNTQGDELYSLSTESNRTFVKAEKDEVSGMVKRKESERIQNDLNGNDSTDITETLSSGSDSEASSRKSKLAPNQKEAAKFKQKRELKKPSEPKPFTRNDAQRMVNKRMIASGLQPNAGGISTAAMKRLNTEMSEKRHKLKQKYPHFYATRNKIKKLVDKLCSTKLPEPVADLLKRTKPIKPRKTYDVHSQQREVEQSASDNDSFEGLEITTAPMQTSQSTRESDAFKQRLERILASPMRQPNFDNARVNEEHSAVTQVHSALRGAPVPLTRKRVMFNTNSQNVAGHSTAGHVEPVKPVAMN